MSSKPLSNYLRTARRRTGLSQAEVAHLLGSDRDTTISRHETVRRLPDLRTAIGYEIIYAAPVRDLFLGEFQRTEARVRKQAEELVTLLEKVDGSRSSARKLETLTRIIDAADPVAVPLWSEEE